MLEVLGLLMLGGLGVGVVWLVYNSASQLEDIRQLVADSVEEGLKRQDDRIRKRIERSEPTAAGPEMDSVGQSENGIRAGFPINRSKFSR